jgi:RNA ligase (TIGR02306 family)
MAYKAVVCKLKNVRSHPNADKLNLAQVANYQIIISKEFQEGDLGIYFPTDGQLSHEHCMSTRLYRKDPSTNEPMGGFFRPNRKVETIKLRGEYSNGFWQPIESFAWCGPNKLKNGDEITHINGHLLCEKYYTPATRRQMGNKKQKKKAKISIDFPGFKQHFDTSQLRTNIKRIPEDAIIIITTKLHGTSGRTGRHLSSVRGKNWFWNLVNKFKKPEWKYVSGSRRVTFVNKIEDSYYKKTDFRDIIHRKIKSVGLHKGETLYYEIVGYQDNDIPLMGVYNTENKDLTKQYGKNIVFSYGCSTDKGGDLGQKYDIYIYRITYTSLDGYEIDLSWPQMVRRAGQLGFKTVPHLETFVLQNKIDLVEKCRLYAAGADPIEKTHPIEGVVVRVEHPLLIDFFKWKSDEFCELENIRKNDDQYVDLEEIS